MKIFLDTNIFLAILNQEENWELAERLLLDVHNGKYTGYTSVICVSEILSGFYAEGKSEKSEIFLTDIKAINNLTITDVDLIIAKDAAKMRAKYKIKLPDAMIAASCMIQKCKLITQDQNLKKVREIEVKSIRELLAYIE